MTALTRMRKAWRPVLVGALVLAGLATTSTTAVAASTNRTGLCNKASYWSYLQFPSRGGFSSYLVAPGKCWSMALRSGSTEPVHVYAYRTSDGATFWIDWKMIKTGEHNVFRTYGEIPTRKVKFSHR
ncbi:hypothetical protein ACIBTZ_25705 [Micromonospora sp. NPDC049460]|uniref:hypothetical protein n=1 Tax=unclassified Micromonospora TaxID=2617518 RepID=UPI0037165B8D